MPLPMVATLSDRGWVSHPREKLDYLFAYYVEGEMNTNLQTSIAQLNGDVGSLIRMIQTNLQVLLNPYFDSVSLQVSQDPNDDPGSAIVNLILSCTVTENGVSYDAAAIFQGQNSKFAIIANMNNTGEGNDAWQPS